MFQQNGLGHGVRKQVQAGDQPELEAAGFEPMPAVVPQNDAKSLMPVPMSRAGLRGGL